LGCRNGSVRALSEYNLAELREELAGEGFKPVHAATLLRAYYAQESDRPFDGLLVPPPLAALAQESVDRLGAQVLLRQESQDGTAKLLIGLADGKRVESVLMPDYRDDRAAGCISSQVGCAMGCDFCATAQNGFLRNLTAGEIVSQFLALRREARRSGRRLQTVVFMGMGEPMQNLDAVIEAARRMAGNDLGGLGWRQITVSTVGVVPGIDALASSGLGVHLAISLHAPDDATRSRLLPMGRKFGIEEILSAADRYQAATGRPVTIQYCLLRGVNDSPGQARQLAALLAKRRMHVNLLRYNPTGTSLRGFTYETSPEEASLEFLEILKGQGVVAHFRRPRGRDIDAACGQLRNRAAAT